MTFSGIFVGSIIGIAVQILFGLLGSAIGLTGFELERGEIPKLGSLIALGFFGTLSVLASFSIAGYVAARVSIPRDRFTAILYGAATWGLVTLAFAFFTTRLVSGMGGVLARAGVGASTAFTASSFFKELSELKPRIVTDLSIMKGKAVTTIETRAPGRLTPSMVVEQVKDDIGNLADQPQLREDAERAGELMRKLAASSSWIAFFSVLAGLLASSVGGWYAWRSLPSITRSSRLKAA